MTYTTKLRVNATLEIEVYDAQVWRDQDEDERRQELEDSFVAGLERIGYTVTEMPQFQVDGDLDQA